MPWLVNYLSNLTAAQITSFVSTYWIIPAGMLALYFYGAFHFNTPDYRLGTPQDAEAPPLLTMAPPKFTTIRTRFRRYALGYILILQVAFLSFVLYTSIFISIAALFGVDTSSYHFDTASLQYKALFALFFLTGLLSSFPIFKEVDAWILRQLHQAALIPDDAKLMAARLFDSAYRPSDSIRVQVRQTLQSRDTIRFAENKISGNLEKRVVYLLWLHGQLKEQTNERACEYFTARFDADLTDVARTVTRVKPEFVAYFKEQAKLVPDTVFDIDEYLSDQADNPAIAALAQQRAELLRQCESVYYRVCLLTSVLAYSARGTIEEIGDMLETIGFAVKVHANPIMDWDAVFRVVGSVFVLTALVNMLFMAIAHFFPNNPFPADKPMLLIFAAMTTTLYFVAIYSALKIKRRWRRITGAGPEPSENAKVAILCYLLTLPISIALSVWWNGTIDIGPFLFAANQGIVGYFIAVYVDRSLAGRPFSWRTAELQALSQAVAAFLIFLFMPPSRGFDMSPMQQVVVGIVFVCQAALNGFLVGTIFQYFYRRASPHEGKVVGDMTVETLQPAE